MAKKRRMIDPDIWEDPDFGKLSDKAQILFIACFSNADDEGRLVAEPSNLRALAFRYADVSINKVEELTDEVAKHITNFKVYHNGTKYVQFTKWTTHQKIRADRLTGSKIPPCQANTNKAVTDWQPSVNQVSTKRLHSIVKYSIAKHSSIVEFLNITLETKFSPNSTQTKTLIQKRLDEGYTVEDFKTVILKKKKEWEDSEKMERYLRPATLFSEKFENYLNQK